MTHHPTHRPTPATLPQDHSPSTRVDRVDRVDRIDRIDAEPAHLTGTADGGGGTPDAVRHYIVGCRASALVLEREGHAQEAGYLRRVAAAAEAAEAAEIRMQQRPPMTTTGGGRR